MFCFPYFVWLILIYGYMYICDTTECLQTVPCILIFIYVLAIICTHTLYYLLTTTFISDIRKMCDFTVSKSTDYIHNGEQINHLVAGIKVVTQTGSTSE